MRNILIFLTLVSGCASTTPEPVEPTDIEVEAESEASTNTLLEDEDLVEGDEIEYQADARLRTALILPRTVEGYPRGGVTEWYNQSDPDAGFVARVRVRNVSEEPVSIEVPQMLVVIRGLRSSNCRPSRGGLLPTGPSTLAPGETHTFSYRIQCRDMRTPGEASFQGFIHFNQPDDYEYPHPDSFRPEHRAGDASLEIVDSP